MDGLESINDILQLFYRETFETFHTEISRDDVLNILCKKSGKFSNLPGLKNAVWEREKMGSTFFGNGIAAPQPIFPVSSSDTFIAIGVSPQPITWDSSGNNRNLWKIFVFSCCGFLIRFIDLQAVVTFLSRCETVACC